MVSPWCHHLSDKLEPVNRTDRLHAISEALRRAGASGITGGTLATDLEVSPRTIKRDVSALQQAGALIWSQPGPGGGYVLDGSASLPPIAFSPSQAVAIATALAVLPPASPFSADVRAASAKVFDTLSTTARQRADILAERVWVMVEQPERNPPSSVLRAIECSLADQTAVAIHYRSASNTRSKRTVEPIIAAWTAGRWHLVAHCRLRNEIRWFRFDRIERADATRDPCQPRSADDIGQPPQHAEPVARPTS